MLQKSNKQLNQIIELHSEWKPINQNSKMSRDNPWTNILEFDASQSSETIQIGRCHWI